MNATEMCKYIEYVADNLLMNLDINNILSSIENIDEDELINLTYDKLRENNIMDIKKLLEKMDQFAGQASRYLARGQPPRCCFLQGSNIF